MDFSKAMGPAYAVAENTEELKAELADAGCKSKRNKLFIGLTAGVAIVLGAYNGYEWMFASDHVETDNAYVDADVAQVTPQLSAPARNYSCPIRKRSAAAIFSPARSAFRRRKGPGSSPATLLRRRSPSR